MLGKVGRAGEEGMAELGQCLGQAQSCCLWTRLWGDGAVLWGRRGSRGSVATSCCAHPLCLDHPLCSVTVARSDSFLLEPRGTEGPAGDWPG